MPSADPMGAASAVAAKPSTLEAPATPDRQKRRTWFGLVTPTRKDQRKTATLSSRQPQPQQPPTTPNGLEELDATPDAKSINRTPVPFQRPWNDEDQFGSERDWDSDQEGTVRYKGSRIKANSEDEPVRMKDMATLATLTRNNTVKPKPSFSRRIFSRGATDRDTLPADFLSPSKNQMPPGLISPSKVPQRSSSVTSSSIPVETNPHPPPPPSKPELEQHSPLRKPLPDVPPFSNGGYSSRGPPLSLGTTDIAGPADIVITPSSPHEEDPFEHIFGLGPSVQNRSMSAPISPTPTMHTALTSHGVLGGGSGPTTPSPLSRTPDQEQSSLGLGLPRSHSPHSAGSSPNSRVAVSSPLPHNPSPKVAFDEDQEHPTAKPGSSKARPRSLSLMFGKSAGEITDDEDSTSSKFSWLGVGKVIRRRRSDMKLMRKRSGIFTDNETSNDTSPMDVSPNGGERTPEPRSDDAPGSQPGPHIPQAASEPAASIQRPPPSQTIEQPRPAEPRGPSPVPAPAPEQPQPMMIPLRNGPRPQFSMSRPPSSDSFTSTSEQEFYPAQEWSDSSVSESPIHEMDLSNAQLGADWLVTKPASAASPLGSLPEGSMAPPITTTAPDPAPIADTATPTISQPSRHGRGRSLSDAARTSIPEDSSLLSPDSGVPSRPPLSSRSSSGNSVVLGKMRGVFTKSSRPRSNSLLRYQGSGTSADEREEGRQTPHSRPGSASSSFAPSPALPPVRIRPEDVPQVSTLSLQSGDDGRRIILTETPPRSPRSSYAASVTSYQTQSTVQTAHSNRRSATDNLLPVTNGRNRRARASTIASGAISWHGSTFGGSTPTLTAPPPTSFSPTSPGGGLQRTGSLRRLSQGIFRGSGPSSPKPAQNGAFPLPPRPVTPSLAVNDDGPTTSGSPGRTSSGNLSFQARSSTPQLTDRERKERDAELHPRNSESAEDWLERLEHVSRKEVAGILAASADPFHTGALAEYMRRFDFTHIPLDVALRRLLMVMSLPKETQQIDRVVEAFSKRYDECEANLFGSTDNAYVLAFSMMMLHTDAFNRHNKNKMTKADYVRNTRLDGVSPTVLEAFFDNITFTPFVFIDDDEEAALAAAGMASSSSHSRPTGSGKIDVYDLIVGGQLGSLRVDVERYIPPDSPFSCMGTRQFLDVDRLQKAFANAHPLQFVKSRPRRKSLTLTGVVERPTTPVPKEEIATIKITKVGLLGRREDHLHGNTRRAIRRGWKNWSVVLTGAQLLFFKDTIWALTLVEKIRNANPDAPAAQTTAFQPDEVMSVKDCVAIYDRTYTATPFTFRLLMPGGNSYLLQASDEHQMNEWLTLINYASTFKTAGIRMRPLGMDDDKAVLAGNAAAESHQRDLASGSVLDLTRHSESSSYTRAVVFAESEPAEPLAPKPRLRRVGSVRATPTVDIRGANDMVVGGNEQFDAVMGSVREELLRVTSPAPPDAPSRADRRRALIESKIGELKLLAEPVQSDLQASLRLARNLALLTPFQRATKERIESALPELADKIRGDRMELSKLHLWITMLLKDQEREAREWSWAKNVALQAANKHLVVTRQEQRRNTIDVLNIPDLNLPDEGEEHELELRVASPVPFPDRGDSTEGAFGSTLGGPGGTLGAAGAVGLGALAAGNVGTGAAGVGLPAPRPTSGVGAGLVGPAGAQFAAYANVPLKDPNSPTSPTSDAARMSGISAGSGHGSGSEYMSARSSMLSFEAELDKTFGPRSPSLSLSPSKFKNKQQAQAHTQALLTGAPLPLSPPPAPAQLQPLQAQQQQLPPHLAAYGRASHHHQSAPASTHSSNPSPSPRTQPAPFPVEDERDWLRPEDPREQAEHWKHTRAASKVSLAKLPRSSIGELTERIQLDRRDFSS